jgi:hypothetical protein
MCEKIVLKHAGVIVNMRNLEMDCNSPDAEPRIIYVVHLAVQRNVNTVLRTRTSGKRTMEYRDHYSVIRELGLNSRQKPTHYVSFVRVKGW